MKSLSETIVLINVAGKFNFSRLREANLALYSFFIIFFSHVVVSKHIINVMCKRPEQSKMVAFKGELWSILR